MKKLFTNVKPVYQIVILDIIGGILINAILQSKALTNSKISISVIIGIVIALVIIAIFHKAFKEQQEELMKQMDAQFEKYFVGLKELSEQGDTVMENHCKELEEKIQMLESNITAFPFNVARGFVVFSIVRKSYQQFYDSDWVISGDYNGEIFACHITRTDEETVENLMTHVKETKNLKDIFALDQYAEIYPEEKEYK